MGQRPGGLHALLLEGDGGGLDGADPDRQITHAVLLAEQDDWLIGGEFHSDPDDSHRMHVDDLPP